MNRLDWNLTRYSTRDRLLDYDFNIVPPHIHSAGLSQVYPWEEMTLTLLSHQLYEIAKLYGFTGTVKEFFTKFGKNNGSLVKGTLATFPVPGDEDILYLDEQTEILYYFKSITTTVYTDLAAQIGVAIVGTSIIEDTKEVITYLYIPVRALPMENLIYDCGDATEYID